MKTKLYNSDNLKKSDINETVVRVKAFILNKDNQLLLATSNGGFQLPGGHLEFKETYCDCIIREVKEETGIDLDKSELIKPFFRIHNYTRNYFNSGRNRCNTVVYYLIKTDKHPDLANSNLTENEKRWDLKVNFIELTKFKEIIDNFINTNENIRNKTIAKEMLVAFAELKKIL